MMEQIRLKCRRPGLPRRAFLPKAMKDRVLPQLSLVKEGEGSALAQGIALPVTTEAQHEENLAIARGLKQRDVELLDTLILTYQHRLFRYLLYLTGSRELSEDLFQETWMRVLQRGGQYHGAARFDTWLFTIARNLVIDVRRKRTMSSLEELCDTGDDERPFEPAACDPTPLDTCLMRENSERVAEALLTLEPLSREVLVLRFHEELSLEEIAKVTRAHLSTVKSRLYRGLAALKPRILNGKPDGKAETKIAAKLPTAEAR
jgi:RNA polymerase sigma-70 factor (ECF subfamily)